MVVLTSFPPPEEGVKHCEPNTVAHIQSRDLGKGTLYIAESRLSWVADHGQGFSLEYPAIALHAVSRDLNSFPDECLYLMIDAHLDESAEPAAAEEEEEEDGNRISEVRFVPADKAVLDDMFKAMSECQSLHPDPQASASDDDDEGCYDDAEDDDDEDEGGEYDVSAAEGFYGSGDGPGIGVAANDDEDAEPMDVGQFDDAEPEH